VGWIRLAQLSPGLPPVDLYVSPADGGGSQSGQSVAPRLAYGTLAPYATVAPGAYIVAMRSAGAAENADPVTSAQVTVVAGQAYTVAAIGPPSVVKLQVLTDRLDTQPGKSAVRVIEASRRSPAVSVSLGDDNIVTNQGFPAIADYQSVGAGAAAMLVTVNGNSQTVATRFAANSTYTVVLLDGAANAPRVVTVADASGMGAMPQGGVETGLGGAAVTAADGGAAHRSGSMAPAAEGLMWLCLLVAAVALRRLRRRGVAGTG
jgi:hypothetical protein